MLNKMFGTIKWYDPYKGYGYITGYDDSEYYFSYDNVIYKDDKLLKGDKVLFIPIFENKYRIALDIEKED